MKALFGLVLVALAMTRPALAEGACPRQCLYDVLDRYLAALKTHDPDHAPWAVEARTSENNVMLHRGAGLWQTISGLGDYDLRFADPDAGEVVFYGTVDETLTSSPFAVRLKVKDGRIVEAETAVARPQEAGVPFVTAKLATRPELTAILPPAERSSRARMLAVANGYFDTLQRNDGTLHTEFADDCNRREDGKQTTNTPDPAFPTFALGCAAQFKLGLYRYDDELRARRFPIVDEERGLVLAAAFIDHIGALGAYTLTDGRTVQSKYRRPQSFYLIETFKIRDGKIQGAEAVLVGVPYGMKSAWLKSD